MSGLFACARCKADGAEPATRVRCEDSGRDVWARAAGSEQRADGRAGRWDGGAPPQEVNAPEALPAQEADAQAETGMEETKNIPDETGALQETGEENDDIIEERRRKYVR